MEFHYRELVDSYFFYEDDIVVLNYDGTLDYWFGPPVGNWPGDGTPYRMIVNGPGTKKAFDQAFDILGKKLNRDDTLLIHTNNHGGVEDGESYICTYSGPDYFVSDFCSKLKALPPYADLMVMMEQCHSGGFNDAVIESSMTERTTFAAACTENRSSWGCATSLFDCFARDWISALAGNDPFGAPLLYNPDYNHDMVTSARELFAYADDTHYILDSPVYSALGRDAGDQSLRQKWTIVWRFKTLIIKELGLLRQQLGPDEYRKALKTKVIPALMELDDRWAVHPESAEVASEKIKKIIGSGGVAH